MSVIVTANFEGETFEVEIFHDGSIEFPDKDFEHDQVVVALGGKPSAIVRFENDWIEDSIGVVCGRLNLPESSQFLLAADFADHALYIFENKYMDDNRPRQAVDAVRNFIANKINASTLKKHKKLAAKAWDEAQTVWAKTSQEARARDTKWAARMAAWAAVDATTARAYEAAWGAARAAAYHASLDRNSVEWRQAYDAEVAWQVRRFVDCMEAIGQGKGWPNMKETP